MAGRLTNGMVGLFCAYGAAKAGVATIETFSGTVDNSARASVEEVVDAAIDTPSAVNEARKDGLNNTTERDANVLLGGALGSIAVAGGVLAFRGGRGAVQGGKNGF